MYPPFSPSFVSTLKRTLSLFIALTLALATLWAMPPQVARAAGFTVNSTTDAVDANPGDGVCATATGECTLRAAIMEANALVGDDTIDLPAGTYTLTIAGVFEDAATTGDLDIMGNLNINGAGVGTTIIDGNGSVTGDRVFHITGAFTVNISGATIRGGRLTTFGNEGGGGVYNNGGTLTLSNSTVAGNGLAVTGGGIYNNGGTVTISNSTVSDNTAGNPGGGIHNEGGTLTISSSTLSGNVASTVGGAISNFNSGVVTITNSAVITNTGGTGGGGIWNNEGTITLTNSTISGNNANGGGGGIFNNTGGTLSIANSMVSGNVALSQGGGIANGTGATLNIISSTINGNSTLVDDFQFAGGGGIFTNGPLTITNSTISGNRTPRHGGGLLVSGSVDLSNVTITENTADSDSDGSGDGGGIFIIFGPLNFRNTLLAGNIDNGGQAPECNGTLNSQGYNLIQNTTGCTIVGDLTGNVTGVDPLLGPLQDNGGPTFTHALLPGSPAIDAGNPALPGSGGNACEAADQRGVARPQGAACDIGAYEFVPAACATTVTIDFPPTTLPFPGGTNITNEFSDQGIVFSSDDSDLPPEFQKSLGSQENRVAANVGEGGTFYNLFRLIFISAEPVVSVSVTLRDSNYNPQTHTLTAFDATGVIVDSDSFTESDLFPDPFTLTVSSSAGIAFIVAIEQPFGAEMLESISYTTAALATFPTTPVLDNFNREDGGVGPNWRSAKAQGNYRIVDEELEALAGGAVYWKPESFGPDQEACVTLTQIDREGHHSVLLKVQHNDRGLPAWQGGTIAVFYDRLECCSQGFGIETYVPGLGWTTLATFDVVLQDGDQIGGRALADGTVQAFVNGVLIGEADAGPFFTDKGGSIGMWFLSPGWPHAILDDFSGGE